MSEAYMSLNAVCVDCARMVPAGVGHPVLKNSRKYFYWHWNERTKGPCPGSFKFLSEGRVAA